VVPQPRRAPRAGRRRCARWPRWASAPPATRTRWPTPIHGHAFLHPKLGVLLCERCRDATVAAVGRQQARGDGTQLSNTNAGIAPSEQHDVIRLAAEVLAGGLAVVARHHGHLPSLHRHLLAAAKPLAGDPRAAPAPRPVRRGEGRGGEREGNGPDIANRVLLVYCHVAPTIRLVVRLHRARRSEWRGRARAAAPEQCMAAHLPVHRHAHRSRSVRTAIGGGGGARLLHARGLARSRHLWRSNGCL